MRIPAITGIIRRRLLVNFRADAEVIARFLPPPFAPKLHKGWSIVGICLIRLEKIRPVGVPSFLGLSSENAAHRIAVSWDDGANQGEGVFIPRRDTNLLLNHIAGGRVFPGEHHYSHFEIKDEDGNVSVVVRSDQPALSVSVDASEAGSFPPESVFESLEESSRFFSQGSIGYSATSDCCRFDGIRLETEDWEVASLNVAHASSSFFEDGTKFPVGSIEFDHALIMRDTGHKWIQEPDIVTGK